MLFPSFVLLFRQLLFSPFSLPPFSYLIRVFSFTEFLSLFGSLRDWKGPNVLSSSIFSSNMFPPSRVRDVTFFLILVSLSLSFSVSIDGAFRFYQLTIPGLYQTRWMNRSVFSFKFDRWKFCVNERTES